ncbi:hypothetical protein [Atlantibacter subterraneus]|nr:hypothetical protein [Atlantibacter subterranea]MDW2740997.1 hypothetical protein [Atlantibacter subterranea]
MLSVIPSMDSALEEAGDRLIALPEQLMPGMKHHRQLLSVADGAR